MSISSSRQEKAVGGDLKRWHTAEDINIANRVGVSMISVQINQEDFFLKKYPQ